jgi:hypothetical protein
VNKLPRKGQQPVRTEAIATKGLLVAIFLLALLAVSGCAGRPESAAEEASYAVTVSATRPAPTRTPMPTPVPATATARKPTATFVPLITPSATPEGELSRLDVPRIELEVAKQMADAGEAILVDVRSKATFEQAHIAGAISMPSDTVLDRYQELPSNKLVIFY